MLGDSILCTCFSPQGQIINSSLLELKHIKPNPHLALILSLIPTLSLTLKPTPSLSLTPPLTLKHYPLKNTHKQKTRIEIANVTVFGFSITNTTKCYAFIIFQNSSLCPLKVQKSSRKRLYIWICYKEIYK